MVRVKSLM